MKPSQMLILSTVLFTSYLSFAQTKKSFEPGSETMVEETTEQDGNTTTRRRVEGRVKPREGKPRVGEIYPGDVGRVKTRVESHRFWSFNFGPFATGSLGSKGVMYGGSIARHYEVSTKADLRFKVNAAIGDHSGSLTTFGIGASFMPSIEEISPVFGGEFGAGYATGDDISNGGGFAGGVFAGVRFFRTSDVQMEVLASWLAVFTKKTPSVYGLTIGILY